MNVDKNLIKHWAFLFESEEAKRDGDMSYLEDEGTEFASDGGDFKIENGVLVKYRGKGGDVVIPDGVKEIMDNVFLNRGDVESVTIPDGVTSIGEMAFAECSNLKSVTIPDSVTRIGDLAFLGCSALGSVTIGNGVTSIGSDAFSDCDSLTSMTIPDGVTDIKRGAFVRCPKLTDVVFQGKTEDEVKSMKDYPWGLKDQSVIKCDTSLSKRSDVSESGDEKAKEKELQDKMKRLRELAKKAKDSNRLPDNVKDQLGELEKQIGNGAIKSESYDGSLSPAEIVGISTVIALVDTLIDVLMGLI